ncbi:hypothetical protein KY285_020418 [Solanum tuberosum]|nr:hypothetical protein KY285_020418 [Solanum tuberosum]
MGDSTFLFKFSSEAETVRVLGRATANNFLSLHKWSEDTVLLNVQRRRGVGVVSMMVQGGDENFRVWLTPDFSPEILKERRDREDRMGGGDREKVERKNQFPEE